MKRKLCKFFFIKEKGKKGILYKPYNKKMKMDVHLWMIFAEYLEHVAKQIRKDMRKVKNEKEIM